MIKEKMKASQCRQKSYHDKWRNDIEFQVGYHVFLRVNLVIGVGRALKSKKLASHFIDPYHIIERVGEVAYHIVLPPLLLNIHSVFRVSRLQNYVYDPSHVIQVGDLQVR